ncbi:MAG TPA: hypothetical protein VD790_01705 [Thermoleophilaceae bacterium]|nr:hypothetical protein [Thermoleophilaceae bacterium]
MRAVQGVVVGVIAFACSSTAAMAAEISIEGEQLTRSSQHMTVVQDANASGGQALKLLNNDRASWTFTSGTHFKRVLLALRGNQCGNPPQPHVSVKLDGTAAANQIWSSNISAVGNYVLYEGFVEVAPGTHTLHVHMTNDFNQAPTLLNPGCSRDLFVDKVSLKDMPSMFAPDSYFNAELPANTLIDANSATYVERLLRYLDGAPGSGNARYVNTTNWSSPLYVVPRQQATVPVRVNRFHMHTPNQAAIDSLEDDQWAHVPLPSGAASSDMNEGAGFDKHLVVYQPETDTMWEFFYFNYDLQGRPQAVFGGRIKNVSQNPGHYTDPPSGPGAGYGATATSIPMMAGLQTIEELKAGEIDHAVSFSMPNVDTGFCRWPAQRTDGGANWGPGDPLPEGIRFRLPADLNLDQFNLSDYGRMVAEAAQEHGMILVDGGGNFALRGQDPLAGPNPYPEIFDGEVAYGANGVLRNFPFDRLQALAETFPRPARCTEGPEVWIP